MSERMVCALYLRGDSVEATIRPIDVFDSDVVDDIARGGADGGKGGVRDQ